LSSEIPSRNHQDLQEEKLTDTRYNRRSARRLWLCPVAILVSFPIGGYLADLVVDGVDSVGAALIGGLIAGLVIGRQNGSP
jgi:hypothetical protein